MFSNFFVAWQSIKKSNAKYKDLEFVIVFLAEWNPEDSYQKQMTCTSTQVTLKSSNISKENRSKSPEVMTLTNALIGWISPRKKYISRNWSKHQNAGRSLFNKLGNSWKSYQKRKKKGQGWEKVFGSPSSPPL